MGALVCVCLFVVDVAAVGAGDVDTGEEGSALGHRVLEVDTVAC